MHRRLLAAPLAVLLAVAVAGCTGGSETAATSSAGGAALDTAAALPEAASGAAGEAAPGEVLARVAPTGADLIRTAQLSVRVDDVRAASRRAGELARAAGGAVEAESSSGSSSTPEAPGRGEATLTLRVAPERFDATVDQLGALGEETSRTLGTEDVTDQVVDLESRLATQRASVDRVRALLDRAQNLGEVVQVEGELTRRTADLESLQARLTAVTERVDRSSITLRLHSGEQAPQAAGAVGFGDGLRGGWAALVATGRVAAATLGALLPFLPFLVLGAVAWRVRARRTAAPAA